MKIVCYGSRGSIPVSGNEFQQYGGDTTCMLVEADSGHKVIIDAGSGIRQCGNHILKNDKDSELIIIFTHAHWDHLLGFPFFKPLYHHKYKIAIYGPALGQKNGINEIVDGVYKHPYFPVSSDTITATLTYKNIDIAPLNIGSLKISSIPLSHPDGGFGYKFEENGKTFIFLTDNELDHVHNGGLKFAEYINVVNGADLLIHDAEYKNTEYDKHRNWGHSNFHDTVQLGIKANVKVLGLFHHNQDRTDLEINDIVEEAKAIIKANSSHVKCLAVAKAQTFKL